MRNLCIYEIEQFSLRMKLNFRLPISSEPAATVITIKRNFPSNYPSNFNKKEIEENNFEDFIIILIILC